MAINPRVFALVATLGGGCVGVPLILWKESIFGTSTQTFTKVPVKESVSKVDNKSKVSRELSSVKDSNSEKGKCEIENISEESVTFLLNQKKEGEYYVEIFCNNTDVISKEGSLPHIWTGLFPEQLFSENFSLEIGKKFDIKTKTEKKGEMLTTTFEGNVLKSPIEGARETTLTKKEETVISVSISGIADAEKTIYIFSH